MSCAFRPERAGRGVSDCLSDAGSCAVPAPGYRERANGALVNVGNNGYSYSSSVSGSNGVYLNFNVTNLNPSNANNRAFGLQLRCLSAFIPVGPGGWKSDVLFSFLFRL